MRAIFDQGPFAPCPEPFNMAAYVLAQAGRLAHKHALSVVHPDGAQHLTFGQLRDKVLGTATGLVQSGLKPGGILLMRLGNTVEFPIAYLAAIAVGIIPVPTSSMLTAAEVDGIMTQLSPAAVLHDPAVPLSTPCPIRIINTAQLTGFYNLPPATFDMGDPNRLAYIIYTSGTSGSPRAVMHAHRAIWARHMMHWGWYALQESDHLLHAGAFNWTYTLGTGLMDPWSIGATALIPQPDTEMICIPDLLKKHNATIFAATPGVYRKMLATEKMPKLPNLRHGLSGGEKLPDSLRHDWQNATDTPIYEAYGMSECSTFISAGPSRTVAPGVIGYPQTGRRIAIVDDKGPVNIGTEGTIAVHKNDPGLMLGYFNAPEETQAKFLGDWFLTGDQGVMAENGAITYIGRADDMMNAGGYRVSPLEVESALTEFPGIHQIGVTDVPIKPGARVIAGFYTASENLDEQKLQAFAQSRLARYKQPRLYMRLQALPTNLNGKLNRRALRAAFKAMS